jgi:hypothetical protein
LALLRQRPSTANAIYLRPGFVYPESNVHNWARLLATVGLAVAMLGAPCRNCAPKEDPKPACGHDCCPKPKPHENSKSCSWQPAGFDAVEKAKISITPDWQSSALVADSIAPAVSITAAPRAALAEDRPPPLPPPAALPPLRI